MLKEKKGRVGFGTKTDTTGNKTRPLRPPSSNPTRDIQGRPSSGPLITSRMARSAQQSPPTKKVPENQALQRISHLPFLFTFVYIALLVIPWVLTCLLNKGKFHLKQPHENYGYHNLTFRAQPRDIEFNTNFVQAIDILSYIAAVAALPVIYGLLSRAVAVYSQRKCLNRPLSAKQLFSLADGRFTRHLPSTSRKGSWLYPVGTALVVLCEYILSRNLGP